ncbi:thioredoxin [Gabonibacter chumensis]|uniref:thioredoxin n=1 Tax=Gabonibacter chumensis TaxID=2972474 RepID=UPI0025724C1C|nr:thioredoxin [Gabonibacter chumensis]MCR9012642.1 thioredoxin [Gabonibacter chumensis]
MEKFNELIQGDKLVLVDFYATWCGPCKTMHPVLEDLKKRLGDKITIVKVDVDVPANRQPVYTYHIQSVPTLMLFKQGRVLWNNSGVVPVNQLQQIIEKHL